MKKIMALVCAMGIVAGANAQVKLTEKAQNLSSAAASVKVPESVVKRISPATAAKEATWWDTIMTYASYQQNSEWSYSWFWNGDEPHPADGSQLCNNWEVIKFMYGPYVFSTFFGGGEYGYYFPSSASDWYQSVMGQQIYDLYVTAAGVNIISAPRGSSLTANEEMPFFFKLYTEDQIGEQAVLENLDAVVGAAEYTYIDVVFPTDPDDCYASDTVGVPVYPTRESQGATVPGNDMVWAAFPEPQLAGNGFCIGMVYPHDGAATDTLWNVTYLTCQNAVADWLHATYGVIDFDDQRLWQNTDGSRIEDRTGIPLLEDDAMQPNMRYGVVSMDSYSLIQGEFMGQEVNMWVSLVDEVSASSANKVDRYVEVSPVPAFDNVTFKSSNMLQRVEIYGMNGQVVKQQNVGAHEVTINVSELNAGMYIAKVYTEAGVATKKVIVR